MIDFTMYADSESKPTQRIMTIRRDYNTWVANETLEDFALRFTPRSFRKWPQIIDFILERGML